MQLQLRCSAEADRRKEYIQYLEQHKDLTVDGFVELNKQLWMGSQPPRPRMLQLPRSHPDAKRYIDWKRVSYLRTMQHERIASMMSDAEKAAVRERGRDVLADRTLLSAIAQRTGVYMDDEVFLSTAASQPGWVDLAKAKARIPNNATTRLASCLGGIPPSETLLAMRCAF
eukprot:364899-Chlamydomonas_euryale.AAC.22